MTLAFLDFVHDLQFDDLPEDVVRFAKRCVLDLCGVAIAAAGTDLSIIIRNHAAAQFGVGTKSARMLVDGRKVSPAGAALAGGMTIDALDGHDGHKLIKGHVGCAVFPTALAVLQAEEIADCRELLTSVVIGYEVGTRAGLALHSTADDYHTSGAWVALACAALGARALGLDTAKTREAIGIAEYHGPRSQMMRCIDHPTMLKDGSGWGAMAGVSAAYLAADGFTGAPAITVEDEGVAEFWSDLGSSWRIFEQYFKPYPVCRWAQPSLQAVLDLRRAHSLSSEQVERIEVTTFHQSVRLATRQPLTTEQAQYSTSFPTAAAMVRGKVGPEEVLEEAFRDPEIIRLSQGMVFRESEDYNAVFPARRLADVSLLLKDGRRIDSEPTEAHGDPEAPLSDEEIRSKFHGMADTHTGAQRATELEQLVDGLDGDTDFAKFLNQITAGNNR